MNLGFRQLETFRLFARTQNVTETARLLRISQPAVSQTLKEIEAQFGFQLFVRSNGRTRLTSEATAILPDVERLFAQMTSLRGKAAELKDTRAGQLSIAAVPTFTARILPQALSAFREERPQVKLRVEVYTAADVVRQIRQEYSDIGFAFLPVDEIGVAIEPLMKMSMICLVPHGHALATRSVLTAGDLEEDLVIAHGAQTPPGLVLRESLRGTADLHMLDTNQSIAALHMVQAGLGIAFTHPLVLPFDPTGSVVAIPFQPAVSLTFALLYSRNRPVSRLILRFETHLRKAIGEFSEQMQAQGLECQVLL